MHLLILCPTPSPENQGESDKEWGGDKLENACIVALRVLEYVDFDVCCLLQGRNVRFTTIECCSTLG